MLPLDGSIAEHAPAIVRATAAILPRARWPDAAYIDLTAGSCLLALLFAAGGMGRTVVNDAAPRTTVAARALFGGRPIAWATVERSLDRPRAATARHRPSASFIAGLVPETASEIFDRLYFARAPREERAGLRYLAVRWALAPRRRPAAALRRLVEDINVGVAAVAGARVRVVEGDMVALARRLRWPRPVVVTVNPPTNGLDEYTDDDRAIHSLIANRLLPVARSRESADALWTRLVREALSPLPAGALAILWGGDGAMTAAACRRVWRDYGDIVVERRAGPGLWAILRRGGVARDGNLLADQAARARHQHRRQ